MNITLKPNFSTCLSTTRLISTASALVLAAPLAFAEPPPAPETPAESTSEADTAPVSPAATGADLAALLDGVERQCQYNKMLEGFWRHLANPKQAIGVLQPELQKAIGAISVTDQPDFRMYSIPVQGAWHQVPVKQIQFGLGKGNGIHVLMVEFDAAAPEAKAIFEPLVQRSKLDMANDPNNTLDATTDLVIDGGKARLICDLST